MSKRIFGGGTESTDQTLDPTPTPATMTSASTTTAEVAETQTVKAPDDGTERNVAGEPVSPDKTPLGDQSVTGRTPQFATVSVPGVGEEREEWGGARPTLEQLDKAGTILVRTADPNLKRTYVSGMQFTPIAREVSVEYVKSISKTHLAPFASDPSIEVKIK